MRKRFLYAGSSQQRYSDISGNLINFGIKIMPIIDCIFIAHLITVFILAAVELYPIATTGKGYHFTISCFPNDGVQGILDKSGP